MWRLLCVVLAFMMFCKPGNEKPNSDQSPFLNLNDTVQYVGMNACRGCHESIYQSFMRTGMGQSFGKAGADKTKAEFGDHHLVFDSVNNFYYLPQLKNNEINITEFRLDGTDTVHLRREIVEYIVGSGQHTNSHLISENGFLFQAPITFYTQQGKWDLAPGFEDGFSSRFSRVIGMECITCHNGFPKFVKGSENRYVHLKEGIDCERCHGPGALHVREKKLGNIVDTARYADFTIVNPARLSKPLQMDLCQRCHLQGIAVLKEGRDFEDFKPGMHLREVMNVFLPRFAHAENDFIMASQADRLRLSKCYKASELTCITCHNPHVSVMETAQSHFNNTCLKCHHAFETSIPEHQVVESNSLNCVECHMPQSGSIDIPHVSITDHFIRKKPKPSPVEIGSEEKERIQQFLAIVCLTDSTVSKIEVAQGYLAFYEKFSSREVFLDSAFHILSSFTEPCTKSIFKTWVHYFYLRKDSLSIVKVSKKCSDIANWDAWTFYRVGEALLSRSSVQKALAHFDRAVEQMPLNTDFLNKQASANFSLGNTATAQAIYEKTLRLNSKNVIALSNLSYIHLVSGNHRFADSLVTRALLLDPDYFQAKMNKVAVLMADKKESEAIEYLLRMRVAHPENKQVSELLKKLVKL